MEILMSIVIGVLFMTGTYLVLSRNTLRIILGCSLMTHGLHLLIMTMAGLKTGAAPILNEDTTAYTDPLPQALILTSIVISFGVTAFYLVLAYRSYKELNTDDMEQLRGQEDE
ncbi:Na(+)/H(+) antiporter subunit C [Insulibacter thermoxylanivorax]|jgi:multicomponent Na+:H+ antiporter subunit C|uniref:Na(+)/H(+) antiporter subunit C n=1 Tax=Insulibacter thermoxylanivorax TaxID=2749268 RepID=A0A916VFT6_9BACL|nr:Na(+)/H(+) antiporter subunit C [Insulibacter thermoxylanivorax]GFR38632.1 Na(+)/H(+) antiporter subunit C [Insulibacter thermoxylanivorax]